MDLYIYYTAVLATVYRQIYTSLYFCKSVKLKILRNKFFANPEFEATPMHNIDYSIAHARAHGTLFLRDKIFTIEGKFV